LAQEIPKVCSSSPLYARDMQATAVNSDPTANSNPKSSFAGALAAFASETEAREIDSGDGLADDVAVLSYESAVRAQAGFQVPNQHVEQHFDQAATADDDGGSGVAGREPAMLEMKLKSASITIRMSEAECAQLRKRAAEAGLTISAYLRSCTFEAEALRAQVKQALAELRASAPEERRAATHAPRRWWRPWPHPGSRSAQA
jgi:predicted DNA binding CopG/RHH family protein